MKTFVLPFLRIMLYIRYR